MIQSLQPLTLRSLGIIWKPHGDGRLALRLLNRPLTPGEPLHKLLRPPPVAVEFYFLAREQLWQQTI